MTRGAIAWTVGGIVLVAGVAFAATYHARRPSPGSGTIPVAVVKRGAIQLDVHATGQLQASRQVMLTAPTIGGDSLQITKIMPTGQQVKKGDVVIEFDPKQQLYKLEQSRSELKQAQQEILKAKDDARVLAAEDKVDLLKARFGVRQAELDVQKDPLLSKIDVKKNQLALEQAKRQLAEEEKDIRSHTDTGKASIYLAQQKYEKAKLEMQEAQQNLSRMKVTAPISGLVSLQKNMQAAGGFFFTGMTLPDFQAGDTTYPGTSIAQIIDPMKMNLNATVNESDRSDVHKGQVVNVRFYALPDKVFRGTVTNIAGMSSGGIFSGATSGGQFRVSIQIAHLDPRLRPGLTAKVLFVGESQKGLLYIPRIAVFAKDGKQIAYVRNGSSFRSAPVKIVCESESRVAVQGLKAGEHVALIDPTVPMQNGTSAQNADAGGSL